MRTPPKSKIDRLVKLYKKYEDARQEIKDQYKVGDNYIGGQMKVALKKSN